MSYKIPLFDLNFNFEEARAVVDVINSKWISAGPRVLEFEERFAELLNVKYAIAVSNCTVSLHLAMSLCSIEPGDEIICPSLTFVATCNAIRYAGAVPVFADIKSLEDLTIDPDEIERKITSKTRAIMVMHYGGFACDMDRIMSIAYKHNLKVIEDACHGPMSVYKERRLGTIGNVGCFSFFSNKNISTGEGGMIITNDDDLNYRARLLRSHGMTSLSFERSKGHSTSYDVIELGYNYRMDDIHAAIGLVQLSKLHPDIIRRSEIRAEYLHLLGGLDKIYIPFRGYGEFSSNYIFTVILKDSDADRRDLIRDRMANSGIQTSIHYPAVHRFKIYRDYRANLPKTEYVSDNLITLPMYGSLTSTQVKYIAEELRNALA
jgi:dTDP-4-amino-4,6-dideoxygalactose transaminase